MKKFNLTRSLLGGAMLLGLCTMARPSHAAPFSFTTLGQTYTQNFDSLGTTGGTFASLPTGVVALETGSSATTVNQAYVPGLGSSSTGETYNYGTTAGATDRAFGSVQSSTNTPTIGFQFTNNTGSTITSLVVNYHGEQYRLGATGRVDRLDFAYGIGATDLATGTYVDVNSLDFNAPVTTPVGAVDGNVAGQSTLSGTISSLSITNGTTFFIRYANFDATGADDGLAIDDFSLQANGTAAAVPEPSTVALFSMGILAMGFMAYRKKREDDMSGLSLF